MIGSLTVGLGLGVGVTAIKAKGVAFRRRFIALSVAAAAVTGGAVLYNSDLNDELTGKVSERIQSFMGENVKK